MMQNDILGGHFFEVVQSVMEQYQLSVDDFFVHNIPILFETNQSNCFPASDVDEIRYDDDKVAIVCNFFGLSGVSSPLPNYLNEFSTRDGGQVFKRFLDAMSQRFFALYFLAGHVFQIETPRYIQWSVEKNNLRYRQPADVSNQTWFAFEAACMFFFEHQNIQIEKKFGWVKLNACSVLGGSLKLGDNSILGERVLKENQSVSFQTDEYNMTDAISWFKRPGLQLLNELIKQSFFAGYEGFIKVHPVPEDRMFLGQHAMRLGIDSWLQSDNSQPQTSRQQLVTFGLRPNL